MGCSNHFDFYGFTSDDTAFAVFKLDSIILCGGISDFNAGTYFKRWYFYSYILKNKLYFKNVFRNVF